MTLLEALWFIPASLVLVALIVFYAVGMAQSLYVIATWRIESLRERFHR